MRVFKVSLLVQAHPSDHSLLIETSKCLVQYSFLRPIGKVAFVKALVPCALSVYSDKSFITLRYLESLYIYTHIRGEAENSINYLSLNLLLVGYYGIWRIG